VCHSPQLGQVAALLRLICNNHSHFFGNKFLKLRTYFGDLSLYSQCAHTVPSIHSTHSPLETYCSEHTRWNVSQMREFFEFDIITAIFPCLLLCVQFSFLVFVSYCPSLAGLYFLEWHFYSFCLSCIDFFFFSSSSSSSSIERLY